MKAQIKRPEALGFAPPHKARTETGRVSKTARAAAIAAASDYERVLPQTRAECLQGEDAQRPCPFVSCKHHLYLEVNDRTGSLKLHYPQLEVWDIPESCALDVADRGGITLEEVGAVLNLTRERIRQIEAVGLAKLKALAALGELQELSQ